MESSIFNFSQNRRSPRKLRKDGREKKMSAYAQVFQNFFKFIFREVLNGSLISPDLNKLFYHVNFPNIIRHNWSILKLINVTGLDLINGVLA